MTCLSVRDKQVLCLCPTVPGVPSFSSRPIIDMEVTILLGGTAQTGGVGSHAAVVPEPAIVVLGAVPVASCILVPVPVKAQVDDFSSIKVWLLLGSELHPIVGLWGSICHGVSKCWKSRVVWFHREDIIFPWPNLCHNKVNISRIATFWLLFWLTFKHRSVRMTHFEIVVHSNKCLLVVISHLDLQRVRSFTGQLVKLV